ncbi:hypothetical protein BU14_2299s0001, partial [Porphyra umbilicalis]
MPWHGRGVDLWRRATRAQATHPNGCAQEPVVLRLDRALWRLPLVGGRRGRRGGRAAIPLPPALGRRCRRWLHRRRGGRPVRGTRRLGRRDRRHLPVRLDGQRLPFLRSKRRRLRPTRGVRRCRRLRLHTSRWRLCRVGLGRGCPPLPPRGDRRGRRIRPKRRHQRRPVPLDAQQADLLVARHQPPLQVPIQAPTAVRQQRPPRHGLRPLQRRGAPPHTGALVGRRRSRRGRPPRPRRRQRRRLPHPPPRGVRVKHVPPVDGRHGHGGRARRRAPARARAAGERQARHVGHAAHPVGRVGGGHVAGGVGKEEARPVPPRAVRAEGEAGADRRWRGEARPRGTPPRQGGHRPHLGGPNRTPVDDGVGEEEEERVPRNDRVKGRRRAGEARCRARWLEAGPARRRCRRRCSAAAAPRDAQAEAVAPQVEDLGPPLLLVLVHKVGEQQRRAGRVDEQLLLAAEAVDGARRRPWPAIVARPKRVIDRAAVEARPGARLAAAAAAARRIKLVQRGGGAEGRERLGAPIHPQAAAEAAAPIDGGRGAPQHGRHRRRVAAHARHPPVVARRLIDGAEGHPRRRARVPPHKGGALGRARREEEVEPRRGRPGGHLPNVGDRAGRLRLGRPRGEVAALKRPAPGGGGGGAAARGEEAAARGANGGGGGGHARGSGGCRRRHPPPPPCVSPPRQPPPTPGGGPT